MIACDSAAPKSPCPLEGPPRSDLLPVGKSGSSSDGQARFPGRPQRVDGAARITVARDASGRSRLQELYQRAPARVLFPDAGGKAHPSAVLLTTSGGLTGGDRLDLSVHAGAGASVTVTNQAAEKIYRSEGEDSEVRIRLSAEAGASVEWLMQETILFEGARLRRGTEADVAPTARLLAVESVVFGRAAMGEAFTQGRLHEVWRVRRDGRLIWVDAIALKDVAGERIAPFGFGDAAGCATLVYAAPDAAAQLPIARAVLSGEAQSGVQGGATCFDGLMITRLVSPDAQHLRAAVVALSTAIRGQAMPRVWSC